MSLTSELRNPSSPVAQWFRVHFPNVAPLRKEWKLKLAGVPTIKPAEEAGIPWSTVGTALDYRLRYYFAASAIGELVAARGATKITGYGHHTGPLGSSPTWAEILSDIASFGLPGKQLRWCRCLFPFFDHVERWLQKFPPAGRRLAPQLEERLCRFCYVLALLEEIWRSGMLENSPLSALPRRATCADLLALADDVWVYDLAELSWAFYEKFYSQLTQSTRHNPVLNPKFAGSRDIGGADADLILNHWLVEFKTTKNPRLDTWWPYQLLAYVLLDYDNKYKIRDVGLYMTRQAVSLRWPLFELMAILADDTSVNLSKLRKDFRKMIREKLNDVTR